MPESEPAQGGAQSQPASGVSPTSDRPVSSVSLIWLGLVVIGLVFICLAMVRTVTPDLPKAPEQITIFSKMNPSDDYNKQQAYQDQATIQIGVYQLLGEYVNWFIQKDFLSFVFNVGSAILMFAFGVYIFLQSLISPSAQGEHAIELSWSANSRLSVHTRSLGIFTIFSSTCVLLVVNLSNKPNVAGFEALVDKLPTADEMAKSAEKLLVQSENSSLLLFETKLVQPLEGGISDIPQSNSNGAVPRDGQPAKAIQLQADGSELLKSFANPIGDAQ